MLRVIEFVVNLECMLWVKVFRMTFHIKSASNIAELGRLLVGGLVSSLKLETNFDKQL